MKKLRPYVLAFHAALAAAILLWALQEKFPGPLTNTLSPVWNSPWEMGKAAFFPLLAAAPTLWVLQKGGSRGGLCLMTLSGAALALALAWTPLAPAAVAVLAVLNLLLSPARWAGALIGRVCISVRMRLLCLAIPGAFGGGDIKVMAAAGLFLGWQHTLLAMFFGILGGGFYGMYLLAARKADKKDHFAFGPFLCVGIVLALLFGDPVLAWYCRFL